MRGPFRFLRFPALVVAVVSAGALLALTTSAGPLFVAAAGGDLFERFSTGDRLRPPAVTVTSDGYTSLEAARYRDQLLRSALQPLTGPGLTTAIGEEVGIGLGREGDVGRLFTRSNALDHIDVVETYTEGDAADGGIWVADYTAERIGAEVGDEVRLDPGLGTAVGSVPVVGIYRDLIDFPVTPYWAPLREMIYVKPGDDRRPPPPILVDEVTFFSLSNRMQDEVTEFQWEFPLPRAERNLEQADAFADALYELDLRLSDPTTQLGASFFEATFDTPAAAWVDQTRRAVASISGAVTSLSYAGRAVALAALAGAGLFAVRRRRTEFSVLVARGIPPWRLGIRSAFEMVLPALVGGALGWAAAAWLVTLLGPEGILARPVLEDNALFAGLTILAGLCAVAVAVAFSARGIATESSGRGLRAPRRLAWEPVVLALAAASFYEIVNRPEAVTAAADGSIELDALLLIFPLLFIAGSAGIVVRFLFRGLGRVRTAGSSLRPSLYLALRRVTHGSGSAKAFVSVAAIAFGVFVFAAVMSSSTEATAAQEASLTVGSDVSVNVAQPPELTHADFAHTTVVRLSSATVDDGGGGRVELLGVDPETFTEVAFWRSDFSETELDELMARLRPSTGQDGLPVLVSGDEFTGDEFFAASLDVPLQVVGRAQALPGTLGANGVVIADLAVLERAFEAEGRNLVSLAGGYDLWAKDATEREVLAALEAEGASIRESISAEELRSTPEYLALTWTFDFLEALGVITSVVVLVGALLFLQARQTAAEASYAIARRMGLTRSSHRASVALEFLAMLVTSALVGAGLAIAAAAFVHGRLDLGNLDQVPLFLVPPQPMLALAAVLAAFAGICAVIVQRRADSADVSQVMRYGN